MTIYRIEEYTSADYLGEVQKDNCTYMPVPLGEAQIIYACKVDSIFTTVITHDGLLLYTEEAIDAICEVIKKKYGDSKYSWTSACVYTTYGVYEVNGIRITGQRDHIAIGVKLL